MSRIVLTDGVARTLFEEYAEHRRGARGNEEIGWVLLGVRQGSDAIVLAALPAGAERDAGAAHVQFDIEAQGLAGRILRQNDKRLDVVGVVHTHPGSMRYPSGGDLDGDRAWVSRLRGGERVFAIGTADARTQGETDAANVQAYGELCFSWYVLGPHDARYRPMPVQVAIGLDQAAPLRSVWGIIETHAAPLNRLCRTLAKIEFNIVEIDGSPALAALIGVGMPECQIQLLLDEAGARYYSSAHGELSAIDPDEPQIDRAVYMILAELAKEVDASRAALQSFA